MEQINIWDIAGVIIALLSFFSMYYIYSRNKRHKLLKYSLDYLENLVNIHRDFKERIEIYFDGVPVKHPKSISITIFNPGNMPIRKDDFQDELIFVFGDSSEIIGAECYQSTPSSLQNSLELFAEKNRIRIQPILLNASDSFSIRVFISGKNLSIRATSRIEGVNEILAWEINDARSRTRVKSILISLLFLVSICVTLIGILILSVNYLNGILRLIVSGTTFITIVGIFVSLSEDKINVFGLIYNSIQNALITLDKSKN